LRARGNGYEGRYYAIREGKRKQLSVYAATEAETRIKLDAALRNEAMGIVAAGPRLTVADYLRDWLASRRREVGINTWRRYRGICEVNIIPAIGPIALVNLSGMRVERMMREAVDNGLSPQTALHMRNVLRNALNRAQRYGMIQRNAAEDAYPPRIRRRERSVLDESQVRTLLSALEGHRLRPMYALALATGMRLGELLGLRWQDVDLDGGIIRIEAQLQRIEGALTLTVTKPGSTEHSA